jgi:PiT family inorganic phosphate transporter
MSIILVFITLLAGGFIGWSIGANDAANCVGADVGSRKMTIKEAIIVTCIFSFLGAMLMGHRVIKTVGKGIVPLDKLDPNIAIWIAMAACFGAGIWVLTATYFKLPVSTSHSVVGAVAGAGLAMATPVIWDKLLDIFICWILTPIGSATIAFLLYRPFRRLFYTLVPRRLTDFFMKVGIYVTSIYLAFTWGANDVANVTGVISGAGVISSFAATVIGALAITIGVVTWGRRVIETVGFRITHLMPIMGIVAEIASALNVHLYTMLGIPVSTSHSMVGAVFGVGLVRGIKSIQNRVVRDIILAWTLTPFCAGLASFLIMQLIRFMRLI